VNLETSLRGLKAAPTESVIVGGGFSPSPFKVILSSLP
jgi:hypothetical protein